MAVECVQLGNGLQRLQKGVFCYVFYSRMSGMQLTVQIKDMPGFRVSGKACALAFYSYD